MNGYEITVVLPVSPGASRGGPTDGKDKEVLARVEKEIKEAGGEVGKTNEWGKRELAYAIKKQGGLAGGYKEGVYFSLEVSLPPDKVGGVNRFLETNEGVLRHLIVKSKAQSSNVKSSSKPKVKNAKSKKVVKKGKQNGNKKS